MFLLIYEVTLVPGAQQHLGVLIGEWHRSKTPTVATFNLMAVTCLAAAAAAAAGAAVQRAAGTTFYCRTAVYSGSSMVYQVPLRSIRTWKDHMGVNVSTIRSVLTFPYGIVVVLCIGVPASCYQKPDASLSRERIHVQYEPKHTTLSTTRLVYLLG